MAKDELSQKPSAADTLSCVRERFTADGRTGNCHDMYPSNVRFPQEAHWCRSLPNEDVSALLVRFLVPFPSPIVHGNFAQKRFVDSRNSGLRTKTKKALSTIEMLLITGQWKVGAPLVPRFDGGLRFPGTTCKRWLEGFIQASYIWDCDRYILDFWGDTDIVH